MRNIIIAFSGFKQSGKTTSANFVYDIIKENICDENTNVMCSVNSFADPFKNFIQEVFGLTEDSVQDKDSPVQYTKKFFKKPKSYRELCILLGDGLKNTLKCKNLYALAMEAKVRRFFGENKETDNVVLIPDVRYKNEIKLLNRFKKRGYEVYYVCVFRKSYLPDWAKLGLNISDYDIIVNDFSPEKSEFEWCAFNPKFNCVLTNDGTKEELKKQIEEKIIKKVWPDSSL